MGNARRTPEEVKPLLCGVVNVQLTPFKAMTGIDEEALRDNTRFMIEHGIVKGRGVLAVRLAGDKPVTVAAIIAALRTAGIQAAILPQPATPDPPGSSAEARSSVNP